MNNLNRLSATDYISNINHFSLNSHWLSKKEFRLDATAFKGEAIKYLEIARNWAMGTYQLRNAVQSIYYPTRFKRIYGNIGSGIPFLGASEIFHFIPSPTRYLKKELSSNCRVGNQWILITRSGTLGKVRLCTNKFEKYAISDDLIRLIPSNMMAPGLIYAFLACKWGKALLNEPAYGSTVDHLEPHQIERIPLLRFPEHFEMKVHKAIISAYKLRDRSIELYEDAIDLLMEILHIGQFENHDVNYLGYGGKPRAFSVSSSELGLRFDASHHIPLANAAISKLAKGRHKLKRLGDIVEKIHLPGRFSRIYVRPKFGVPFIQGSHIPLLQPYDLKYISKNKTKNIGELLIRNDWILITRSGTVGKICVSSRRQNGWAASEHIIRIIPKAGISHPGFIAAFLSTPYGQHQLNSKIYGGIVDELTPDDLSNILIPDVPFRDQVIAGNLMVKIWNSRDKANEIEADAIDLLEEMIEERC